VGHLGLLRDDLYLYSDNHAGLLKDCIFLLLTSVAHVPLTANKSLSFWMRLFKQFIFVCYYFAWLYNPFSTKINEINEKLSLLIKLCFHYNYCGHNVQYTLRDNIQMTQLATSTYVCSTNDKKRICGR